jgi:hypothetical protein
MNGQLTNQLPMHEPPVLLFLAPILFKYGATDLIMPCVTPTMSEPYIRDIGKQLSET